MFEEEEINLQLRTKGRLLQNSKEARRALCFTVTAISILKEYHIRRKYDSILSLPKQERRVKQDKRGRQNKR
jgi:hypothetical protein